MKAIETQYKGRLFRSRLEARWAVFFDTLGVAWEYEEGCGLEDGMHYLPDFWLPDVCASGRSGGLWLEIKDRPPTKSEAADLARVMCGTGAGGAIATGEPCAAIWGAEILGLTAQADSYACEAPVVWMLCRACRAVELKPFKLGGSTCQKCGGRSIYDHNDIHRAAKTATRLAKFTDGGVGACQWLP